MNNTVRNKLWLLNGRRNTLYVLLVLPTFALSRSWWNFQLKSVSGLGSEPHTWLFKERSIFYIFLKGSDTYLIDFFLTCFRFQRAVFNGFLQLANAQNHLDCNFTQIQQLATDSLNVPMVLWHMKLAKMDCYLTSPKHFLGL